MRNILKKNKADCVFWGQRSVFWWGDAWGKQGSEPAGWHLAEDRSRQRTGEWEPWAGVCSAGLGKLQKARVMEQSEQRRASRRRAQRCIGGQDWGASDISGCWGHWHQTFAHSDLGSYWGALSSLLFERITRDVGWRKLGTLFSFQWRLVDWTGVGSLVNLGQILGGHFLAACWKMCWRVWIRGELSLNPGFWV